MSADHEARQNGKQRVRFERSISLGHILTIICIVGPILVWGLRLEGRVNLADQRGDQLAAGIAEIKGDLKKLLWRTYERGPTR